MNRTILVAALASLTAIPVVATTASSQASADVVIRAKARVRIGGSAHVRIRRPVVRRPVVRVRPHVRYRLHVGGYYGYGYRYRYASPPPPSCAYECAPTATYAPARSVGVYAVERPMKRFGIGIFAGGMNVEDREATSDVGLLARFRLTQSLALEGEVAKSELEDGSRIDRRIGAALLYDFSARSKLSPHILVGAGVVRSDIDAFEPTDQAYGEIGVGLGLRLGRSLELAADVRAGSRETSSEAAVFSVSAPTPAPISEDESYTRARISAILYF